MSSYKIRNTLLMSVLALIMFSSCKKDEAEVKPALMSFGPTTAKHGETIKFIGVGLDQVTDIIMPVGIDVPSSAFITHTASLIEITVPEESILGLVTLKTTKGDITSKTAFGAAYEIAVTSFAPATAKPGTNVTITGNFLNYVKQVNFAQGQTVTEFVSQSLTQLVVQVPMAAQTGPIAVTDLAKFPQIVDQDASKNTLILNVTLPAVTNISPSTIEQTKNLTITGTDLDLVSEIDFFGGGKVFASFVSQTPTQIVVEVPNAATTGALTLVAPSGLKIITSSITVIEPVVSNMTTGRVGTENVTFSGTNLDLVKNLIFPGGMTVPSTSFVSQDANSIVAAIPASAIPGTVTIVTIHDFTVNVSGFTITLPVATSYSASAPGASMAIFGTDLDLVASIIFPNGGNGITLPKAQFTSVSASEIDLTIPAGVGAGYLQFAIDNSYTTTQKPKFGNVAGPDPVIDQSLVFFNFNGTGKDAWWGGGSIVSDAASSSDGTPYWSINSSCNGWTDLFWRNSGNNFPGAAVGTDVSNYVLKFDVKVSAALTAGNLKLRLQGSQGDFWYCVGPAAPSGQTGGNINTTQGWTTISVPVSGFKDNYGYGSNTVTDMSTTDTFGMAFDNGSGTVDVAIDNVRFEKTN